jgi:hypothetical protein
MLWVGSSPVLAQDYAEEVPEAVEKAADKYASQSKCEELAMLYYPESKWYALVCESSEVEPSYYFAANGELKRISYTIFSLGETPVAVDDNLRQLGEKIRAAAEKKIGEENEVQWIQKVVEPGKPDVFSVVCYFAAKSDFQTLLYDEKATFLGEKKGL